MRTLRNAALLAAAVTALAPLASMNAFAADTPAKQKPVFAYFNENDVNGSVMIELPDGISAKAEITFDSPEGLDEPYYIVDIKGKGSFSFDIEGRDNTDDDYRNYHIKVTAKGGTYKDSEAVFTDDFTVPDGNDNPNSFAKISYKFTVDDKVNGKSAEVDSEKDGVKTVALHLNAFLFGDVDENALIDASDATAVLSEYSAISTGGKSIFTEKQRKAANVIADENIDASDASAILSYYAYVSTGGTDSLEKFLTSEEKTEETSEPAEETAA